MYCMLNNIVLIHCNKYNNIDNLQTFNILFCKERNYLFQFLFYFSMEKGSYYFPCDDRCPSSGVHKFSSQQKHIETSF